MATQTCIVSNDGVWSFGDDVPSAFSYRMVWGASQRAYGKLTWRCDKPRYYKSAKYSWYAETKKGKLPGRNGIFSFLCYPLRNRGKISP